MKSKKKLSQIKRFARRKVYEFIDVADDEILNQLVLSNFILHLENYSYDNYGGKLISIPLKDTVEINYEKLEQDIQQLCYEKKLALYPTVDEEAMELHFFNKALNNHIKTYQLMRKDEREKIQDIINKIRVKNSHFIYNCIGELKQLKALSDSIHITLVNDLIDEEDGSLMDDIMIDGLIAKIGDETMTLDNVNFASVIYEINIDEDWRIKSLGDWELAYKKNIRVEIVF